MTVGEAAELIAAARVAGEPVQWADLGCGDGVFTRALASILPQRSVIHAIDQDRSALRRIPTDYEGRTIVTHVGDFTSQPWPFSTLDGVLLANSLHYVQDQPALVRDCQRNMNHYGSFLIVEYDTDAGNRWVPYPVSFASLERLFGVAGYQSIRMIDTRRSIYQRARLYAALVERSSGAR